MTCLAAAASLSLLASPGPQPPADLLDEYAALLLRMPNGYVEVADLDLPRGFLRLGAGRSVRVAFRQEFRQVLPEAPGPEPPGPAPGPAAAAIRIKRPPLPEDLVARWAGYSEEVPVLRGFRAALLEQASEPWPLDQLGIDAASPWRSAAAFVASRLSRDGLVATTMGALGAFHLPWISGGALDDGALRAVGIPADLLDCYSVDGAPARDAIARWLAGGAAEAAIEPVAGRATFTFTQTVPGFQAAAEDGSAAVSAVRLQLDSPVYARGPGDGSAVDVLRHVLLSLPGSELWVSIHAPQAEALAAALGDLDARDAARVTVVATPLPVTRWARDNAVTGTAGNERVAVIPRFASRNEQATKFIPGDSFVFQTLGPVVGEIAGSPLAFQGGNLLTLTDGAGRRLLLVGEAEIERNRALGLSAEEAALALRIELGADRCEVLPAVSFHLDMELTVRRREGRLVACLPDEEAASRTIIAAAADALVRRGGMSADERRAVIDALHGRPLDAVAAMSRVLHRSFDDYGRLTGALSAMLVASAHESGSGNAVRLLAAMDTLTAHSLADDEVDLAPLDYERYLLSIRDRGRERRALRGRLEELGMEVHLVPAISDVTAGINPINGVHTESAYLMSALGGLYEALDEEAADAFRRAFGPGVDIVPIPTAGIQSAFGGLHCAVSVYP